MKSDDKRALSGLENSVSTGDSIDTETGRFAPPELSTERVHDIFSDIAPKYERFNAVSSFGAYKNWLKRLVAAANAGHSDKVLDVAGGTGDVTFALAKTSKPSQILCTDLVDEMLNVARDHYEKGASCDVPVKFQVVDAQNMPFSDNQFDVVTMAYGLRNMPQREQALSEIFRVLKPGGRLANLDFSTPPNVIWRGLYNVYLNVMIPFWGKIITGDSSGFRYLSKSIKAFPNQEGVAKLMQNAGFTNISWQNCTGGIACIHTAHKPSEM